MNSVLRKCTAFVYTSLLLSVHPLEAFRIKPAGARVHPAHSSGEEELQDVAGRIEEKLFAEDSSLASPLNLLKLGMQLYKASTENKVEHKSNLRPNNSPAVVALRTLLFKAIANKTGKPGAVQMQSFMQWIEDPANDDITVATQLPFKLLLSEEPAGQEELCEDIQRLIAKAQGDKLEELSPSELRNAAKFEQAREAELQDELAGEIREAATLLEDKADDKAENNMVSAKEKNQIHPGAKAGRGISKRKAASKAGAITRARARKIAAEAKDITEALGKANKLGENSSSFVELAPRQSDNEVSSNLENSAGPVQADGSAYMAVTKVLRTTQGYLRLFGAVVWNVVLVIISLVIGALVCFVAPVFGVIYAAHFGMLWCIVLRVLGKLMYTMSKNAVYEKWYGVPQASEGFFSQLPNMTGGFQKCMQPFRKAAYFFAGTWKSNSDCFKTALTGASWAGESSTGRSKTASTGTSVKAALTR